MVERLITLDLKSRDRQKWRSVSSNLTPHVYRTTVLFYYSSFLCVFRFHEFFSKLDFGPVSWDVAQFGRAPDLGSGSLGFKSLHSNFPIYDIVFHRRHGVDFAYR